MLDSETRKIVSEQEKLKGLVNHEGWFIARKIFTDTILELQKIHAIDLDKDEKEIKIELLSKKGTVESLFDILQRIEGGASEADDNKGLLKESYIVRNE